MDEEWEIEKKVGVVSINFIKKIVEDSKNRELTLIPFIDYNSETVFNILQLKQIKKESLVLEENSLNNLTADWHTFTHAINSVIEEQSYTYLKIICQV